MVLHRNDRPMTTQYRFSHHVHRALTHAATLARGFAHPHQDTGHLLVGVMLAEGSIGAEVMAGLDLPVDVAAVYLKQLLKPIERTPEPVPQAEAMQKALEQAVYESEWLDNHYIGTEHLLLGITRMNLGNAIPLLRLVDIAPEQIRRRLRYAISDGYHEFSMELVHQNARLSELSRRVLFGAQYTARKYKHPAVNIGHLLLVLLQERRGVSSGILHQAGLNTESLQAGISNREAPTLPSIETIVIPAIDQAEKLGSHYVGADHLLLTMTLVDAGKTLLRTSHAAVERINRLLNKHLDTKNN
jgi:ATP-dependent Clp protease ATP-binding subunit ClpA